MSKSLYAYTLRDGEITREKIRALESGSLYILVKRHHAFGTRVNKHYMPRIRVNRYWMCYITDNPDDEVKTAFIDYYIRKIQKANAEIENFQGKLKEIDKARYV